MRDRVLPRVHPHFVLFVAAWIALLGCDHTSPYSGPVGCPFIVNLALLSPSFPQLQLGDTLTMHVKSWAPVARECLPPDTTAAGLWWWASSGETAIDAKGHLTAVRPGLGAIYLSQVGDSGALGQTSVGVFEPPGADSVVTIIRNPTGYSAWVVLEDADGALQRSQMVAERDSACWVTPLSDSVRYSVTIRPAPQPAGSDSSWARWVTHSALQFNHTWLLAVNSVTARNATWTVLLAGRSPDPGKGC